MIRLSCWPRSSIAALLFLSCFCDWPACVGTLQDSDVHRVEWRDVPGRPLQGHALRELSFQQLSPHREHLREVEDTQLRRDEGALQGDVQPESYIVKVHRGKRNLVMQTIRSLYPETRVQYLPLDSYVVVVPLHIAKQIAAADGVDAVLLLPEQMKLPAELHEEAFGRRSAASSVSNKRRTKSRYMDDEPEVKRRTNWHGAESDRTRALEEVTALLEAQRKEEGSGEGTSRGDPNKPRQHRFGEQWIRRRVERESAPLSDADLIVVVGRTRQDGGALGQRWRERIDRKSVV